MRWTGQVLLATSLAAGLAACSKPQAIVLQPPLAAPSGIDGRYRGTARLVQSSDRYCPRSGPRVYEVHNGTITLSYQAQGRRRVPLTATVQSDGNFDTSDGEGRLQGRLSNGVLEMTIASRLCEHRWTMHPIT
ncbi:MAG: hypothetical protein NVSMB18_37490 [Acetobacteraceae bacterium]